ncbi:MAG: hypothetical protein Q8P60_14575 [Pseudorhodobacter sp.]|nr:hypothetical protein [Pseudorhodobacter sp.]
MTRQPRRIIEEAIFDGLGPLSARELIAMPREGWEHLRAGITDNRNGKDGLSARCVACGGQVYITTATGLPLFAHYQGSDPRCPWYSGKNMHPDDARAAQYHGQQESEMHRRMCELIAELAALDDRCVSVKVDAYLPPEKNARGRYPDVLVEWRGIGNFAVEYQMSHTFQTEVSQRCIHYDREGIPLLWVLSSLDPNRVPQPVSDVVHRHRGNAFVLDQAAVAASREQRTLVFSCHMSNGAGYDAPVLVRFDALTFPESKRPYLEDRIAKPLLDQIAALRRPYFRALRAWGDRMADLPLDDLEIFAERHRVDRLVAAAFSIVAEAAGKPENFASEHDNIKGMLNTYQNSGSLAPYARLLITLIENTSQRALLKGSVGEHLRRSIAGHRHGHVEQVGEQSAEWRLLRELLPEALDPFVRQRLKDAGALPAWAT